MVFKKEAIEYAEEHSNHAAAEKYRVEPKRKREWRHNKEKIVSLHVKPKGQAKLKLEGGGRKPFNDQLEDELFEWVVDDEIIDVL